MRKYWMVILAMATLCTSAFARTSGELPGRHIQLDPGEFRINVTPPQLQCVNGVIVPNPDTLTVTVTNDGGTACAEIHVGMTNGGGSGGTATVVGPNPQPVPVLLPTQSQSLTFVLSLTTNPAGGTICDTVRVTSPNCPPHELDFCFDIPACPAPCNPTPVVSFTPPFQGPQFQCAHLCPGAVTFINVCGPNSGVAPSVNVRPGCNWDRVGCDVTNCPPATFDFNTTGWQYDPATGCWTNIIVPQSEGCVCVGLDGILPVELLSYSVTGRAGKVSIDWSTGSETDNDYFEIQRDQHAVARIPTQGNGSEGHSYHFDDAGVQSGIIYDYTLYSVSRSGVREELGTRTTSVPPTSSDAPVTTYALHQNYPNPFNPSTSITFDLVENGEVNLRVYNVMGQNVATVVHSQMSAGRHTVEFNASTLPTGLYLCRMDVNGFADETKMLLIK